MHRTPVSSKDAKVYGLSCVSAFHAADCKDILPHYTNTVKRVVAKCASTGATVEDSLTVGQW